MPIAVSEARTHQAPEPGHRHDHLRHLVEHAAHFLPAQGPITAFVHHNTLHAFEEFPFEQAVVRGGKLFNCHPFLTEDDFRSRMEKGRIRVDDLAATLIDDMHDEADVLLGYLGTRYSLRMAMLRNPLYTGNTQELRWVVAESDALTKFREDVARRIQDEMIGGTRHWVMRDLRNPPEARPGDERARKLVDHVLGAFDRPHIEEWDDTSWEAFTLHLLWAVCQDGVSQSKLEPQHPEPPIRLSNSLLAATGHDPDQLVNDFLVPFCAAFLDQGFARWGLPGREAGFFQSFINVFESNFAPRAGWMRGLGAELTRLRSKQVSPLDSIEESLILLGVSSANEADFITATLLALRGYAGMIWQIESRGDRAGHRIPPDSLIEYLAIRLILDRCAAGFVAQEYLGYRGPLDALAAELERRFPSGELVSLEQRAFLIFQLAQALGWSPRSMYRLTPEAWQRLNAELNAFSGLERRRIFHLAYERKYRTETLDAILAHRKRLENLEPAKGETPPADPNATNPACSFQLVACIDDREESFRRHMEEVDAGCETFAFAGFFAVAMYYRGAADANYKPLCPVIITPQHYVAETAPYTHLQADARRRTRRRAIGTVTHRVHIGSRTFAGGWLAALVGSLASLPLVMRILFPRLTAQFRKAIGGFVRPPEVTQLHLERTEDQPGPKEGHIGYTPQEMSTIVERLLRDIGLRSGFSRIVLICGHGSSSLNNPHEAAYDCGACAGGRGGPNARAFAQMANDPRVRQLLADRDLHVPDDCVFVGCYHNTCDDSVTYYDLEHLRPTHKADFEHAVAVIDEARQRNAHERCRRFESAELRMSPEAALRHVEGRSEDLSQARPECGHATNALCFVGRRAWSREMYLDRRAFLQSYDPAQDDESFTLLTRILQAVIPVCAGINLEYYFSYVDPTGYGCGTKLPHNIAALLGVMDGAASDLRPGLPWQMVEIHEPIRLLLVIESTPQAILQIMAANPMINRLIRGDWVQTATFDPTTGEMQLFWKGEFQPYTPECNRLAAARTSLEWYRGWRDHLAFASVGPRFQELARD